MTIERSLIATTDASSYTPVYSENVFSTQLYTGNGSSQTITNSIDLSTNGGLVWIKGRSGATNHGLYDTVRGATYDLSMPGGSTPQTTESTGLTSFNTNGFSIGSLAKLNTSSATYASWSFRKKTKFFDIVSYTGTGSHYRKLSHSLGSTPGMYLIKRISGGNYPGPAWHRALNDYMNMWWDNNGSGEQYTSTYALVGPSSGQTSTYITLGSSANAPYYNENGATYIAYIFAHDAAGFGATGSDSVVYCGAYTGNGSSSGPTATIGWEPQLVVIKNVTNGGDWNVFDTQRGIVANGNDPYLKWGYVAAEATTLGDLIDLTSTGFTIKNTSSQVNTSGDQYIYLAIRKAMN